MKKSGLIRGMASLETDNELVFYYLSASEIWPEKRGLIRGGATVLADISIQYYLDWYVCHKPNTRT